MGGASIIGIVNQKGGTGKTTSCVNLGVDLAREGKRVLLVDCDPQGSLTISLGHPQPDTLPVTLADQMTAVLNDSGRPPRHAEAGAGELQQGLRSYPAGLQSFSWNADDQRAGSRGSDHHPGSGAVLVHQGCGAAVRNCCPREAEHQSQTED